MQDDTWVIRMIAGLSALAVLAAIDLCRNPENPTRVKEYGFLFGVTGLTIAYGLIVDMVTYTISTEYFSVGKGLSGAEKSFYPDVAVMAVKAAWSAGLVVGVGLLVANNPRKDLPQLGYRGLARCLFFPLSLSVACGLILGFSARLSASSLSARVGLNSLGLESDSGFITVWGTHIGIYVGGLVGLILAVGRIRRGRYSFRKAVSESLQA